RALGKTGSVGCPPRSRSQLRRSATQHPLCAGAYIPTARRWSHLGLPQHLSREQSDRLVAICGEDVEKNIRDRAMVLIMVRLGMRAGEVRQVRLDDVDWCEGVLYVRNGKSRKERKLPLPDDTGRLITAYLRQERPQRKVSGLTAG